METILFVLVSVGFTVLFIMTVKRCIITTFNKVTVLLLTTLSPVMAVLLGIVINSLLWFPLAEGSHLVLFTAIRAFLLDIYILIAEIISLLSFIRYTKPTSKSLATFLHVTIMLLTYISFEITIFSDQMAIHWPLMSTITLGIFFTSVIYLFYKQITLLLGDIAHDREGKFGMEFIYIPFVTLLYCFITHTVMNRMNYAVAHYNSTDSGTEQMVDRMESYQTIAYIFSMMFIALLLIIVFHSILKNIKRANENEEQRIEIEYARDKIKVLSVEIMEALARTIDAKDEYTRGHSIRVAHYSRMIAERLGLSEEDCENIYYYGLLHDIGKIGVPNEIINKPTKLTDEEYEIIKTHPGIGYTILSEIKSRPDLSIGARWHHERIDGQGYPDHKQGEDIPFLARIIAVADGYDAMTSNRSYRQYLPQAVVRAEIEKNIGIQFDECAARCMIQIIDNDVDYKLHE